MGTAYFITIHLEADMYLVTNPGWWLFSGSPCVWI